MILIKIISIFLIVVLAISQIKGIDTISAVRCIKKFFKDSFLGLTSRENLPVLYPVYIGINDYGMPDMSEIDSAFKSVLNDFSSGYFKKYYCQNGLLHYYFCVGNCKINFADEIKKNEYFQKKVEGVFQNFAKLCNPNLNTLPEFTAVNFIGNDMLVLVASDSNTVNEVADYRIKLNQQLQKIIAQSVIVNTQPCPDKTLEKELQDLGNGVIV